ncbi:hypothetical protein SLA2020_307550 [Shorea laevis]
MGKTKEPCDPTELSQFKAPPHKEATTAAAERSAVPAHTISRHHIPTFNASKITSHQPRLPQHQPKKPPLATPIEGSSPPQPNRRSLPTSKPPSKATTPQSNRSITVQGCA